MTIWFDVEDLVQYFGHSARPTGIQRLSFEIYCEACRLNQNFDVKFCRRGNSPSGFRGIHFPALEAGILAASSLAIQPAAITGPPASSRLTAFGRSLPMHWRLPLGEIHRGASLAFSGLRGLFRAARMRLMETTSGNSRIGGHQFDIDGPDVAFGPGDWFVSLGAQWDTPYDPAFLRSLKASGASYALLVYDLVPELFPEWTTAATATAYQTWLRQTVPAADIVFAISRATAADLRRCLKSAGKTMPEPVILPVGNTAPAPTHAARQAVPAPYVLQTGTLEIRKNHLLMFRVWRRLLQTRPAAQVPDLVFAGKIGWLTEDFRRQLDNTGWLNGKIKFIHSPSEPELAALYSNCLFTVFPSFYEGWGLPVTESLCFGKTVAASNRAAIPEAGGIFCAYFDPDNLNDAYDVIAGLITHPERVAVLEQRIAAKFRPPSWRDSAATLLQALEPAPAAELESRAPAQSLH